MSRSAWLSCNEPGGSAIVMSHALRIITLICTMVGLSQPVAAQRHSVVDTVHNLSVSGPGAIKAVAETEVCKFCHVPHNAIAPEPLWGHRLSEIPQYETPEVYSLSGGRMQAPQPDGSSKLCLSCHDGSVALGEVVGMKEPIAMAGTHMLGPGTRGHIGADLSGSHPVSIVVRGSQDGASAIDSDMGVKPVQAIEADPDVRLDKAGKMQCTSCHDPHLDRYYQPGKVPRFWVKPSVEEVCLTCHEPR